MRLRRLLIPAQLNYFFISLMTQSAFAATACGVNCQINFTTTQDVAEVINDFLDNDQESVTIIRNDETGVFTVTLSDGRIFSLMAIGLTVRNQNMMQQRQMTQTDESHLQLRTRSGLSLQLRNAFYQEDEAVGAILRAGWANMEWFRNRFEIESRAGDRMCLEPAMDLTPG